MQNYLCIKFPSPNLKTFSGVLVAKILLENVDVQSHFVVVLFLGAFMKDVNAKGLSTTNSS